MAVSPEIFSLVHHGEGCSDVGVEPPLLLEQPPEPSFKRSRTEVHILLDRCS
jgi:hypothetical protein